MNRAVRLYKYISDRRYSTIAGTLVYFLLMSIAPLIVWLTLVFGSIDFERIMSNELFKSVSPFLTALKSSAESAASGAGIIFLLTTLYSSTNFFYHLRRSGEIIYGVNRGKGGVKLRIVSLLLIVLAILLTAAFAGLVLVGGWLLDEFMPPVLADVINYTFITALAFMAAVILNLFACPYKQKMDDVVSGSLLTTALWLIFAVGFVVYLQFATPEKLYGKIASVIVFLLWCYVMMCCFVIGIIYNGKYFVRREYKTLL